MAESRLFAAIRADRLVAHNFIVAAGTIGAGLLGLLFQSLISHGLTPSDYGAVFSVLALITLLGLPAGTVTLVIARETSRDRATGDGSVSAALLRNGTRYLLIAGLALAGLIVAASPWFARILTVPIQLLVLAAIGVPFSLALPLLLGSLQGEQRFVSLSVLTAGQAAVKLAAAVLLGFLWGPVGVITGISLATAGTYLVALAVTRRPSSPPLTKAAGAVWNPLAKYALLVLCSTCCVAVLFSTDILLVKHFFDPAKAGQYSVVAAVGRAIFWGAGGVAAVLFPKLTFRAARGNTAGFVVLASVLLALVGGVVGMIALLVSSRSLLYLFAGSQYLSAASFLPQYAFAMTLFGVASILIATFQSQGRWQFLWVLLPITGLEPLLIARFHQDFTQVIGMVTLSSGLLLAGLSALYLIDPSGRQRRSYVQASLVAQANAAGTLLKMETAASNQPSEPRL